MSNIDQKNKISEDWRAGYSPSGVRKKNINLIGTNICVSFLYQLSIFVFMLLNTFSS
jgi:hypothetical protein